MKSSQWSYRLTMGLALTVVLGLASPKIYCQTMISAFQKDKKIADKMFAGRNYGEAATRYLRAYKNHPSREITAQLARSYFLSHQYEKAVTWYEKFSAASIESTALDSYNLAESYASLGEYKKAIAAYNVALSKSPGDDVIAKKIWRLANINYLYEDSMHYAVRWVNVNTEANEMAAVAYHDGLIYLSNRETVGMIENDDASTKSSFYHLYFAPSKKDTLLSDTIRFGKPELLPKDFGTRFQEGSVCFFNQGRSMVYTRSSETAGATGKRTLELHFAECKDETWILSYSFPYNSVEYSVSHPAINSEGTILYFSSDMKGGQGGKDLYRTDYSNGKWNKPVNLTELNTPYDEVFPFLHQGTALYFASTGHAGMGGLDIFKTDILADGFSDVVNMGYPVNTHFDDFGLVLDSLGVAGYFTSNRKGPETGDDVYSIDIDMQPYPLIIEGILRYKEAGWKDPAQLELLPNARLILIDNLRGIPVFETFSDASGNFSLHIPYFSQYKLKVVEENKHESIVSLEVPRHRKKEEKHDIVVVREVFRK